MKFLPAAQAVAILLLSACSQDADVPSNSDGGSTGTFTTGLDDTGTDDGSGMGEGDCSPPAGGYFVAEAEGALVSDTPNTAPLSLGRNPTLDPVEDEGLFQPSDFGLWAPGELCADLNPGDIQQPASVPPLLLRIYRPQTSAGTSPGAWPDGRFPVALFHHGIGQDPDLYDHLARGLVEDGMIFANVDTAFGDPADFVATSAAAAMACVMRYVTQVWSESENVGCSASVLGHSRGGLAAVLALGPLIDDSVDVRGVVTLATAGGLPGNVPPDYTRPYLALASATDEDVRGGPIRTYDLMGAESAVPAAPKVILRVYDLPHHAFGGRAVGDLRLTFQQGERSGLGPPDYLAKGHALASTYPRAFLRRHVLERDLDEYTALFRLRTFPSEVLEPSWWDYLDAYGQASGTTNCSTLEGEQACTSASGCAWQGMHCQNQPVILGARWGGAAEARAIIDIFSDGQYFTTDIAGPGPFADWEIDETRWLSGGRCDPPLGEPMACQTSDARSYVPSDHETFALRLRTDGVANRYARWNLDDHPALPLGPFNASGYTHVRLRAGVRSSLVGPPLNAPANCEVEDTNAWGFEVELAGGQARSAPVRPLVQQDVVWANLMAAGGDVGTCATDFFMATFDVPMSDFCTAAGAGGFSVDQLTELAIRLPASNGPGEVIVDTIEFVTEEGGEDALCGRQSGFWGCGVDELALVQSSCDREPVAGVCPTAGVVLTPVDPPTVPAQWGGPFSGFVVHAPAGWIADNDNPSSSELQLVAQQCTAACAQFAAMDPHMQATCSAPNAFATPVFLGSPSIGAVPRIPSEREDGSGLFGGQSLPCSLESTCCAAFDEALCIAAPERPTPAAYPLGVGEEWIVEIAGTLTAQSVDDETEDEVAITGSIGFSLCPGGPTDGPCPFYLGSAHLEATQSMVLDVTCDGVPVPYTLDALEIDLVQPAMGIDFEDNNWKAFPEGALLLRSHLTSGAASFETLDVNQEPVFLEAVEGWLRAQGTGGFVVLANVPCPSGEVKPLKAWVSLQSVGAPHGPPVVSINMPSTVTCSTVVDLVASSADPEGDHGPVAWVVDGVLMESSVTSMEITESHTIQAIVRDARGATTTATHEISCT